MKAVRSTCYIMGFLIFCISACFANSDGYGAPIAVVIGIAIMVLGILADLCIPEDEEFENEK